MFYMSQPQKGYIANVIIKIQYYYIFNRKPLI